MYIRSKLLSNERLETGGQKKRETSLELNFDKLQNIHFSPTIDGDVN